MAGLTSYLTALCDSVDAHFPTIGIGDDGGVVVYPPSTPTPTGDAGGSNGGAPGSSQSDGTSGPPVKQNCTTYKCKP